MRKNGQVMVPHLGRAISQQMCGEPSVLDMFYAETSLRESPITNKHCLPVLQYQLRPFRGLCGADR
jgi:hypothetical protein